MVTAERTEPVGYVPPESVPPGAPHTPGRWSVASFADAVHPSVYAADGAVASCGGKHRSRAERFANARLCAAAPDLLAACKQQLAALDGSPLDFAGIVAAHRALEASVARAEGRTP